MRTHVWRPFYAIVTLVTVVLVARAFVLPPDFGIGERGYMYGWHRKGNEAEWKALEPKYKPARMCQDCHPENYNSQQHSRHKALKCQGCHGPAMDHPTNPTRLVVNTSRELCLRCHASLAYPSGGRARIPGIDPATHNPGLACATCHNPHHPNLEGHNGNPA